MQRSAPPGEAGQGQVGGAPEEVDRAALAEEAGAKADEYALDLHQGAPEVAGDGRIIGPRRMVLRERDWFGDLVGFGDDAGRRAHAIQSAHDARVEAGDCIPYEIDAPLLAIRGAYDELMVEEVELKLEGGGAIGDQQGRKPARGHPQRHVPAVIDPWRARQSDLADDLGPQQQRLRRGPESGVGQDGPCVLRLDVRHQERLASIESPWTFPAPP